MKPDKTKLQQMKYQHVADHSFKTMSS